MPLIDGNGMRASRELREKKHEDIETKSCGQEEGAFSDTEFPQGRKSSRPNRVNKLNSSTDNGIQKLVSNVWKES